MGINNKKKFSSKLKIGRILFHIKTTLFESQKMNLNIYKLLALIFFSIITACSNVNLQTNNATKEFVQTFQIAGEDKLIIRAITNQKECPFITWDNQTKEQLKLRVDYQKVPLRKASDGVPSDFPIRTCEVVWPNSASKAIINDQTIYPLKKEIERIVILGDTGCRLKDADNAYQDCNDSIKWPFKKIVDNAAKFKPDLVVHVGDIHYRESPCPANIEGCKNSPWGYGFDAWKADFFEPAKSLLDTTPWVFVRGNHESCQRAGQGWHRFISLQTWTNENSCNDPKYDEVGNYTEPFAVSLGKDAQVVVFDSANMPSKDFNKNDFGYKTYYNQIKKSDELANKKTFNLFANHHPISIVTPAKNKSDKNDLVLNKNSLTTIMQTIHQDELLSNSFNATMHGHIHTVQAIDYTMKRPVTLVSGNAGSALEFNNNQKIALTSEQKKELKIRNFQSYLDFGFATLVRNDSKGLSWIFTEYDADAKKVFSCILSQQNGKSSCVPSNN